MGKCIGAHHGFVGLNHKTCRLTHHTAGRQDVFNVYTDVQVEVVLAGFNRHDNLFEGAVAGTLAQPVDGALNLPRTTYHHASQ